MDKLAEPIFKTFASRHSLAALQWLMKKLYLIRSADVLDEFGMAEHFVLFSSEDSPEVLEPQR